MSARLDSIGGGIPSSGLRNVVTSLILLLATIVIYLPCFNFDFIYYDDIRILSEHPELYNGLAFWDSVKAIFTLLPREEPLILRDLSWLVDSWIFGFNNPHGYHLVNVFLHAGVVALCFLALLQVTRRYSVALLAAVCFLTLAIHVDPVAWIMGRKDMLVAFFGFLALICHSRAIDAESTLSRVGWTGVSLLALTLALFSKISAVVFPGFLLLLTLFQPALRGVDLPGSPFPVKRIPRALAGILPHLFICLLVSHWYSGVLHDFGAYDRGFPGTPLEHLVKVLVLNPLAWFQDLKLLVAPFDMSVLYTWPGSLTHFQTTHILFAVVVWIGLAGWAVWLLLNRRDLAFYLLTFFVLMFPYMNIHFIGIWVAPRYLYFPAFCVVAMLATWAVDFRQRKSRPLVLGAFSLIILFVAVNAWCQVATLPHWRNAETLWRQELAQPEPAPDAFYNLASYYYTTALQCTNSTERDLLFRKVENLVASARSRFDKPYVALQNLMLLNALVTIVRNDSPERQLSALLAAEQIGPSNDAVLWQLTLFYYRKALSLSDAVQRDQLARKAWGYYGRYRRVTYCTAGFAAKDQSIRAEFRSDFPNLTPALK